MRRIINVAFLALFAIFLLLSPMTAISQAPTRTPNLDATATREQLNLNRQMTATSAAATKVFIRQYRNAAALIQIKRIAESGSPQNVTFPGVVGLVLDGNVAWVKIAGGFVLVRGDVPHGVQTGNRVVVYAVVNGQIDIAVGGQPAKIPNIEHAVVVNTGRNGAIPVVEPTAIPPTKTPTPLPVPTLPPQPITSGASCPNTSYTCSELTCEQAYACLAAGVSRLDRDNDGVPCESVCR